MVAAEIRQKARETLAGKWGKAVLIVLVFWLIMFAITFVGGLLSAIPFLGLLVSIGLFVIEVPIMYGMIISFIKVKRAEEVNYTDFLNDGFSNFGRSWGVVGNILLKMLLLIVLLVVFLIMLGLGTTFSLTSAFLGSSVGAAGFSFFGLVGFIGYLVCLILLIPKSYLYPLSFFIAYDHPEMSTKEAVEESEKLMYGHRWNLFWLNLTFIGWAILSVFTFGIGLLWLIPYMAISMVVFYETLANCNSQKETVSIKKEEEVIEEEKPEVIQPKEEESETSISEEKTSSEEVNQEPEEKKEEE